MLPWVYERGAILVQIGKGLSLRAERSRIKLYLVPLGGGGGVGS